MGPLAAFVLAAVTLGVFAVFHDYGPESAIRRFHLAVVNGDRAELQRVTEQPIDTPGPQALRRWVLQMHEAGAHYQLLRVERHPRAVYAAVVYSPPDGEPYGTVWIVRKDDAFWKVDAAATADLPGLGQPNGSG